LVLLLSSAAVAFGDVPEANAIGLGKNTKQLAKEYVVLLQQLCTSA